MFSVAKMQTVDLELISAYTRGWKLSFLSPEWKGWARSFSDVLCHNDRYFHWCSMIEKLSADFTDRAFWKQTDFLSLKLFLVLSHMDQIRWALGISLWELALWTKTIMYLGTALKIQFFAHSDRCKSAWCLILSVVIISLKENILGGRFEWQKQFLPVAFSGASCVNSSGRWRKKGSNI